MIHCLKTEIILLANPALLLEEHKESLKSIFEFVIHERNPTLNTQLYFNRHVSCVISLNRNKNSWVYFFMNFVVTNYGRNKTKLLWILEDVALNTVLVSIYSFIKDSSTAIKFKFLKVEVTPLIHMTAFLGQYRPGIMWQALL